MEQLGGINSWEEQMKIYHMQNRFGGLACKWYENVPTYQLTWPEWKKLIIKTIPDDQDFATLLRKLLERHKLATELWEQYYFDKTDLLGAWEITVKKAVSCIIGIGDSSVKAGTRAGKYGSLEKMYAEYLSALKPETVSYHCEYKPTAKINLPRRSDDRRYSGAPPYKKIRYSGGDKKSQQRCYNCRESGHYSDKHPRPRIECNDCQ